MKQNIELLLNQSAVIPFTVLRGTVKEISSDPAGNIRLLPGNQLEITSYADQLFTIYFTDEFGCTYTHPLKVTILKDSNIFLPNVFSPNGDQINDVWTPFIGSDYHIEQLTIYDRWGNLVYTVSGSALWDGRILNGDYALPGVYLMHLSLKNRSNELKIVTTDVTILK